MIHVLLHLLVSFAFPPLMLGVINRTKAVFAGRTGPPLLQPYYELNRLARKGSVFSTATTWIFRAGPIVGLATAAIAALLVPLGHTFAPLSFSGDLIVLAYLLGLGRFFTMAAALDTGSAFEGMGSAREAAFACLTEPILFVGLLVLAKVTSALDKLGGLDMHTLLGGSLTNEWRVAGAPLLFVLLSWFVVLLVENSRIPFDDPNTHLELTMIHEVMVLDHSGPALGMILYGSALKLFVFGALVVRLAVPIETGWAALDWGVFLAAMILLSVAIGVVESVMARLRMMFAPSLLVMAGMLPVFGLIMLVSKG